MAGQQFEEGTTLDRFLMETMANVPGATGQFVNLVQSIALAGKMISSRVNRAGLAGMIGGTGEVNIQGEFVQKLDDYANARPSSAPWSTAGTPGRGDRLGGGRPSSVSSCREQFHSGRYVFADGPPRRQRAIST